MCGISGIFDQKLRLTKENREQKVQQMNKLLEHRGPDGEGVHSDDYVSLGHRRLSIIDLSEAGAQPMPDPSGRYWITYNGEVYNYREIKAELEQLGVSFQSHSDTEVVLKAFIQWGLDSFKKLNGIFAFAIWDKLKKEIVLARDPIGIKPLFYAIIDGQLVFASELKSIIRSQIVPVDFDHKAIDSYFTFYYTPSPLTGIKNIKQLKPGTCLVMDCQKNQVTSFWSLKTETQNISEQEALEGFEQKMAEAVSRQLVSDVPVGAFLSGGLDSTAVAQSLHDKKSAVNLLHIRIDDPAFDESAYAKQVSEQFNQPLTIIEAKKDFDDLPLTISKYLEEPMADSSSAAFYLLSKAAKKQGKVFLSGDGGDELLAGYKTYPATLWCHRLNLHNKAPLLKACKSMMSLLPPTGARYSSRQVFMRLFEYAQEPFPFNHLSWRRALTDSTKQDLFSNEFKNKIKGSNPFYGLEIESTKGMSSEQLLQRMLELDFTYYLPSDMLIKADRMSMANGIEVRVPLLDLEFVKYCFSLPMSYKYTNRQGGKIILKKMLERSMSKEFMNRPKAGFNIPTYSLFKGAWGQLFHDIIQTHKDDIQEFLNIKVLLQMLSDHKAGKRDYQFELFTSLMFSLWLKNLKEWSCISKLHLKSA